MKFGEILKELLEQHNLSQKRLAESLDMSPSALSNYIQGTREPDYNTLIRIADYFDVTTDFLLNHPHELTLSHNEELLLHFPFFDQRSERILFGTGKNLYTPKQEKRILSFPGFST